MALVIQSSSDSVAPRPAVLRVDGLSKHFGDKQAVVGLSCQVNPGVIMGLIGPNGAGKTTTIKLILGLLLPSAGRAEVSGLDCTSESLRVRELVGYVPDEPGGAAPGSAWVGCTACGLRFRLSPPRKFISHR